MLRVALPLGKGQEGGRSKGCLLLYSSYRILFHPNRPHTAVTCVPRILSIGLAPPSPSPQSRAFRVAPRTGLSHTQYQSCHQ